MVAEAVQQVAGLALLAAAPAFRAGDGLGHRIVRGSGGCGSSPDAKPAGRESDPVPPRRPLGLE
jgi:hypothetical protein